MTKQTFKQWLLNHHGTTEELWALQNMLGSVYGFDDPNYLQAKQAWEESRKESDTSAGAGSPTSLHGGTLPDKKKKAVTAPADQKNLVSNCCSAPFFVSGEGETHFHRCSECLEPCDAVTPETL